MRYTLSLLVTLAWGLWFGGLITLFLIVTTLFHAFQAQRDIFGQAGSATFHVFERYQLIIGAAALVLTVLWAAARPAPVKTWLFAMLVLAGVGAAYGPIFLTPRLEALRKQHLTATPEFRQLHGRSMMLYTAEAALLLIGGILLPLGIRSDAGPLTAHSPTPRPSPPAA